MNFYYPKDWKSTARRPALVFSCGEGVVAGSPVQFTTKAEYFATRGMVAASAEYRIGNKHHTGPEKCIEDAKSALRWLRQNARNLGVDPGSPVAGGGPAGGSAAAVAPYHPHHPSHPRRGFCRGRRTFPCAAATQAALRKEFP